jgi:hypothetical protein
MLCVTLYWVIIWRKARRFGGFAAPWSLPEQQKMKSRKESRMAKRLTRHNGRAGKSGVYKSTHNDRTFNTEHADHIDGERIQQNIYWDCFRGATYPAQQDGEVSFADVERAFYLNRYSDYLDGQHERNAKRRHSERDRSVDDLLADKRFCPEETIYQIGTMEDSVSPEVLLEIVGEFMMELEHRFGEHIHVIDWALHLDEATPHIHERHVFDYVNRYGEVEPKQEKALEALGFELPDPEKKPGRTNNRKMVFDAVCRVILFDICKQHGLAVEEEPDPGNRGRSYLMKNDYIIQKQKKLITEQETAIEEKAQALEAVSLRLEDAEALIDEVTEIAYDKAVELVTDAVRAETQLQDEKIVSDYKDWCLAPERRYSPAEKGLIGKVLGKAQELIHKAAQKVLARVQAVLRKPEVRAAATRQIKEKARESVLAKLEQGKAEIARQDAEHRAAQSATRHSVER